MKRFFVLFFISVITLPGIFAQGFSLTVNCQGIKADSIHLQQFDGKKDFSNVLSVVFAEKATLKQKAALPAGYYSVAADTNYLFTLLISEEKKQSITANVNAGMTVEFTGSDENQSAWNYEQRMVQYGAAHNALYQQFADAQKTMPEYMLQTLAERLQAQDAQIAQEEAEYKDSVAQAFAGTLLASIAQFDQELPPAPQHYYQNRTLLRQYYCQHCFDYYPFNDLRMTTAPMTTQRLRDFCANALYLSPADAAQAADNLLAKAQVNASTYHFFYDWLAKTFGSQGTPFYNEPIYLAMLNNALKYNSLDKDHRVKCETEYKLHTLNMEGTTINNFKVQWADGTRGTLHDVEAEYLLVYFQNPECPECTMIRGFLAENEELNQAIASGRLKVVTIYFEDDEELWKRYITNEAKAEYLHGWDYSGEIDKNTLFDLRAIPYMFLVDKDKKIIKKDLLYNEVSDYLKYFHIID